MIKISRLADYATLIMSCFAKGPLARYSARAIADQTRIAFPAVSKILKLLCSANLLVSTRGSNGGYQLAKSADQISVAAIIGAIDGEPAITQCIQAGHSCQQGSVCHLRGNWQFINKMIVDLLESVTLADMCRSLQPIPLKFYRTTHTLKNNVSEQVS